MPTIAPSSDRQARIAQARELVFQGQNSLSSAGWGAGVSAGIAQSWQRCLAMGLEPNQAVGFDAVSAQ